MEKNGGRFLLRSQLHSKQIVRGLCMLVERQCLVDVAICCGGHTLHAHKCVLAAISSYFKEHFENKSVEQVIVSGLDYSVMKSIIEFIYVGETSISEEQIKYLIAAAKLFRITELEHILEDTEYKSLSEDEVIIPPLQFTCKPPKYPTVYKPFNNTALPHNYSLNNPFNSHKLKRKSLGTEAEKACAKEAQASRIALANLRKVMASTPQVHSFIVEDSFNETTVENFIPNVEESFTDNIQDVQFVEPKLPQVSPNPGKALNMIPLTLSSGNERLTADKIKHILGNEDVEIMFQTSDGNFVDVSDEVLLNLSKGGLQYQVVDENGQVGEVQELKALNPDGAITENINKTQPIQNDDVQITEVNKENINPMTSKNVALDKFTANGVNEFIKDNSRFVQNPLDPLPLTTSFGNGLYEESFNMQASEMFEPENLSMHSALIDNTLEFSDIENKFLSARNDSNNRPIVSQYNKCDRNAELDMGVSCIKSENYEDINVDPLKISPQKQVLKFTPDMFFADLSSNNYMESRSENNQPDSSQ